MTILARAPAKAILFGEHYAVFGAPGIVAAIGPCNEMEMEAQESDAPGLEYFSTLEENNITVGFGAATERPAVSGASAPLHPYEALYLKLANEMPPLQRLRIRARVKWAWPLKGVGNSASLGAALGAGLRMLAQEEEKRAARAEGRSGAGEGRPPPSLLFEDAQAADEVAHGGGRPSGIDAAAAAYGGVLEFEKDFANPLTPKISPIKLAPMKGVEFILIDTFAAGEKRGNTAALVAAFARMHGIDKKPGELGAKEREAVFEPYRPLFLRARRALGKGQWEEVGRLMDENHRMLKQKGVSSPRIERAVAICKSFGALGAKLSGAGGTGGVVITLAEKKDMNALRRALEADGFAAYRFEIEKEGARAKKI